MTCSVRVYILITSLSDDLTAPLPWIYYTSVKDFTILQKRLLLHHANHQRVEMLHTVHLLLKAFSGGPSLPIAALQRYCRLLPVCHGCKPSLPTPIGYMVHALTAL
jgi:hypothetical protein